MRRMLGAHSMVIRVDEAGDLLPFEMMPELFLGRSLRRLLTPEVRSCFEDACRRVVASGNAEVFAPDGAEDADGVVVTPVFDDRGVSCVCACAGGATGALLASPPPSLGRRLSPSVSVITVTRSRC